MKTISVDSTTKRLFELFFIELITAFTEVKFLQQYEVEIEPCVFEVRSIILLW